MSRVMNSLSSAIMIYHNIRVLNGRYRFTWHYEGSCPCSDSSSQLCLYMQLTACQGLSGLIINIHYLRMCMMCTCGIGRTVSSPNLNNPLTRLLTAAAEENKVKKWWQFRKWRGNIVKVEINNGLSQRYGNLTPETMAYDGSIFDFYA